MALFGFLKKKKDVKGKNDTAKAEKLAKAPESDKKEVVQAKTQAPQVEEKKAVAQKVPETKPLKAEEKKPADVKAPEAKTPKAEEKKAAAPKSTENNPQESKTAAKSAAKKSETKKTEAKATEPTPAKKAENAPIEKAIEATPEEEVKSSDKSLAYTGRFEINKSKDGKKFFFNLYASNKVGIATSQMYSTAQSALNGVKSVIANAPKAPIEDQSLKNYETLPYPKWEIYVDNGGKYRFRLNASNGNCVCHSQGYTTKNACKNGIDSIIRSSKNAEIDRTYIAKKDEE
ncbi:MAG: DUF1508 domain-containing protein [Clostridia bacterium]|nr:DUF1508 domain-containing protein [Clostridia bacterium]